MKRREFLSRAGAGLALLSGARGGDAQAAELPNIVLCMADDQGWGDMAYNGHETLKTPHFDAMARETLRFDRFYAAAPVCSPTRGSVMTGRHPNRFGCFSWGHTLRPQEITVAEMLKKAGYVTGHFGKWHLGSVQVGSPVNPSASGFDTWVSAPNFFDNDPVLSHNGIAEQHHGESSMVTVDAALEFIREHAGGGNPFFAVVWFGSPHGPHRAVEEDRAHYNEAPENLRDFYGEITGMDRAFGKLRGALRELGVRDNTVLWYCSDNGGLKAASTGGRGRKGDTYEGGLRVPALLEWPARIKRPRTTKIPCNTVDIYPTLARIAGVSLKYQLPLDGVDLVPLLDGTMKERVRPMGFWKYPTRGVSTPSAKWMTELLEAQARGEKNTELWRLRKGAGAITQQYPEDSFPGDAAWLDWPWKLHRKQDAEDASKLRFELYNLEADPMEAKDLLQRHRRRATAMRAELETWLASVTRSLNGKDYY